MAIIQGNAKKSTAAGGFYPKTIEGSLRFNDDDSAYLSWTPDSAGNRKTWTLSLWTKRGRVDNANTELFGTASEGDKLAFSDSRIFWFNNGSASSYLSTTALFRDPSAWYHIVLAFDTTQATASNRVKLYVNGERIAFDNNTTFPSQNYDGDINNAEAQFIGMGHSGTGSSYDGYMAEVHFIDGQSDTASITSGSAVVTGLSDTSTLQIGLSVGGTGIASGAVITSIDSSTQITMSENATATNASATLAFTPLQDAFGELKNGVWVAKTPDVTYGTNGFYLDFQDDTEVEAFNTVLYRGNGLSSSSVTGMGFEPDLVWIKARDGAYNHILFDSVRGVGKYLPSSEAFAENWAGDLFPNSKPTTDGFIVDGHLNVSINESGKKYVAWGWKAGGAPTVDNSAGAGNIPTTGSVKIDGVNSTSELAGTIPATRLSASTTYGFSIVSYTGTGTAGDTVGHELDSVPDVVIVKNRDDSDSWQVYHSGIANAEEKYLRLNYLGKAEDSNTRWNDTAPSSSVFTLGSAVDVNNLNEDYIAYCWAETAGYSKFDSFAGEGSNNTTISKRIYTTNDGTVSGTGGFRPSMIIFKRTDIDSVNGWYMFDSTRDTDSVVGHPLFPDQTYTEGGTESVIEFNDDGFTIVRAYQDYCGAGGTYVYMAFADTRDAAFWLDQSGNDNDWQPVNLDHNDTVADSPTDNFATLNPLSKGNNVTLSDGNLKAVSGSPYSPAVSTIGVSSGKWYVEAQTLSNNLNIGITAQSHLGTTSYLGQTADSWCYATDGNIYNGGSSVLNTGTTYTVGDVVGMALDMDAGDMYVYKNGDPVYSGNAVVTGLSGTYYIGVGASNSTMVINFGQQPFKHDPPA